MKVLTALSLAFLPELYAFSAPSIVSRFNGPSPALVSNTRSPIISKPSVNMLVEESMQIASSANLAALAVQEVTVPSLLVGTGYYLLANMDEEGEAESGEGDGEVDIYRDTLLRYLGYSNELGEAFAPIAPAWVVPGSYVVAVAYVLADTVDKAKKAMESGLYAQNVQLCGLIEAVNAFVWQILASVALPGFTIHQIVKLTEEIEEATGFTSGPIAEYLPTFLGLATIPLIVKPLDELAEVIMDLTLRKLSAGFLKTCELPPDY